MKLTPNQINYADFKQMSTEKQLRYLLRTLKRRPKSYLYYNGSEGFILGIMNQNFSKSLLQAQKNLAENENVDIYDVQKDYDNWYYVEPVAETIERIQYDLNYELKFK